MVETQKYQGFRRLVTQTGEVIELRTTHEPELLDKYTKVSKGTDYPAMFIFKSDKNNQIVVNETERKSELAENLFDNGLRIMMYDKIVKSGFCHLSIFLDDFNFIYNEVITSTNNLSYEDVNIKKIHYKKNKGFYGNGSAGINFDQLKPE